MYQTLLRTPFAYEDAPASERSFLQASLSSCHSRYSPPLPRDRAACMYVFARRVRCRVGPPAVDYCRTFLPDDVHRRGVPASVRQWCPYLDSSGAAYTALSTCSQDESIVGSDDNPLSVLPFYVYIPPQRKDFRLLFACNLPGTNNARIAALLRSLASYYCKDSNALFVVSCCPLL